MCTFEIDCFSRIGPLLLSGRDLFSRSRLRGMQGARVCSRREFGPRRSSVARALGVQSRSSWHVITGSLSDEPQPTRPLENHTKYTTLVKFSHVVLCNSPHLGGSHVTTAASLFKLFPFVAATSHVFFWVECVRVCVCAIGPTRNTNLSRTAVHF